jgi:hypothetical protein
MMRKIESLQGKGKGRKCLIVGHGENVDDFDFSIIPADWVIFGVNCTEHAPRLDYYVCYDKIQCEAIRSGKIKLQRRTRIITGQWGKDIGHYYFEIHKFPPRSARSNPFRCGVRAVYIAQLMEFDEIYLIGFSFRYREQERPSGHFSRDYALTKKKVEVEQWLREQIKEFDHIEWGDNIFHAADRTDLTIFPVRKIKKDAIRVQTAIFTHTEPGHILSWHRRKLSNVHIFFNGQGVDTDDVTYFDMPDIKPWLAKRCFPMALRFPADYYILMENDAYIINHNFERDCIRFMRLNQLHALAPHLHTGDSEYFYRTGHERKGVINGREDFWSILGCVVLSHDALTWYSRNFTPKWHEIDMFTQLQRNRLWVAQNPYIDPKYFCFIRGASLSRTDVRKGYEQRTYALHPVKDPVLLNGRRS